MCACVLCSRIYIYVIVCVFVCGLQAQAMGFVLSEKKKDESAENDLKKSKENIIALVSNINEVRILLTFPKLSLKKQ